MRTRRPSSPSGRKSFRSSSRPSPKLPERAEATVRDLSHDGRGVASVANKTVFIDGALTGEKVQLRYTKRRGKFDEAIVEQVLEASPDRVDPLCPHFNQCGGCQLQHLAPDAQLVHKQQLLLRTLERIGKVVPEEVLPPIAADPWHYRRRARLAVRYLAKEDRVELGFRASGSERLVPISQCPILLPPFEQLFKPLTDLIAGLQSRKRIPQLELVKGDRCDALNIHLLTKLSDQDRASLLAFSEQFQLQIYLQSEGTDSVEPLAEENKKLSYPLADFDLELEFLPASFLQVNPEVNRQLVNRAVDLLKLDGSEKVLDLFCGLGNFTLPLARKAKSVVGVEGSARAIQMAEKNASFNQIDNTEFYVADLSESQLRSRWGKAKYDAVVLDPPRSGASGVIPLVGRSGAKRIVYVSCHPGSLARDVGELVRDYGYRLVSAGAAEMFPHTAHLESIVLLEKA